MGYSLKLRISILLITIFHFKGNFANKQLEKKAKMFFKIPPYKHKYSFNKNVDSQPSGLFSLWNPAVQLF